MGSDEEENSELHVVMFPFLAFGHIFPFVNLSNKLSSQGVRISFFTAAGNVDRIKSLLVPTPTTQIIPLIVPDVDGLPPGVESTADTTPATAELLKVALDLTQPQVETLISQLKPNFVLFDFAQDWLPPLATKFGIKTVFYSIFNALCAAYLTVPSRTQSSTITDLKSPPVGFPDVNVKAMRTFEARDFLYMFTSFHGKSTVFDRVTTGFQSSSAILFRTCNQMEAPYIEFIRTQFDKPVLLAGPVVPEPLTASELDTKWSDWLGQFPAQSVVYCSFGSEATLKDDEIREVALGLELTGLPFFLVLNFPSAEDKSKELQRALPEGFMEKVKGKGVVHTGWVQQQHILAHDSVGCHMGHAGLSSVIEAMVNGCQLVMLTRFGDQLLNSKLVSLDLKVGVEVNRRDEDGHFGKEDVCEAIKTVMVEVDREPGISIRANHKKWREFLLNNEEQSKFVKDLVKDLKAMVD